MCVVEPVVSAAATRNVEPLQALVLSLSAEGRVRSASRGDGIRVKTSRLSIATGTLSTMPSQLTRWSCSRSSQASNLASNVSSRIGRPTFFSVHARRSRAMASRSSRSGAPDLGHHRSTNPSGRAGGS